MDSKIFYKSKIFWTAFLGFLVTVGTTFAPVDYKDIILSFEGLIIATLTIFFRWNTDTNLRLK